jgi:hypothetical protein
MTIHAIVFAALLPLVPVLADDTLARARLIGVWQQQDESGKGTSVSIIETKSNSLHITTTQGDQKLSEIECKPTGTECEGTGPGKKVKVLMYFSGPALVQIETAGSDITKRQFAVTEQPDIMELAVTAITGNTKSETVHFKRMPSAASR